MVFILDGWLLISLCAPTIGLFKNSDEMIGDVEDVVLPIEIANHS